MIHKILKNNILKLSLVLLFVGWTSMVYGQVSTKDTSRLPENFYKYFTGTIAGQPVSVEIWSVGGEISGRYIYDKYQQNISLDFLAKKSDSKRWVFGENVDWLHSDQKYPIWKCRYDQGKITGTWYSKDGSQTYVIHLKENYPDGVTRFTYKSWRGSFPARLGKEDSPQIAISFSYPVALGNTPKTRWLNKQTKFLEGFDTTMTFRKGRRANVNKLLKNYRDALSGMDSSFINSFASHWRRRLNEWISFNRNGYVEFRVLDSRFSGGVHPNHSQGSLAFDMKHQKLMKRSDITSIDSLSLQHLLEAAFRKNRDIPAGESLDKHLFRGHIPPNDNFYFNSQGIEFIYNPYEIASYATGFIYLFIPYKKLKGTLNPEFVKRMGLKDKLSS